jgi:hypothetical protein
MRALARTIDYIKREARSIEKTTDHAHACISLSQAATEEQRLWNLVPRFF